jgi:hypothetical protein
MNSRCAYLCFDYLMHPALFPIALSLILGVSTLRQIRRARHLQHTGVEVLGRVVHQREVSNRSGKYFIPTIRFTTYFGQLIEAESAEPSAKLEFFDGNEVVLYYNPNQPNEFLLAQELNLRSRYGLLVIAALLLILAWVSAIQ